MSRVTLINPRWRTTKLYGFKYLGHGVFPPLGLLSIASYLISKDIKVQLIDAEAEKLNDKQIVQRVKQFNPDVIGLTSSSPNFIYALNTAKALRENIEALIVLGGIHASTCPKEVLGHKEFDYVIIGEGEITFYELVKELTEGIGFDKIRGLAYKDVHNVIRINEPRPFIQDLDSMPMPAYELLDIKKYKPYAYQPTQELPFTTIFSSRGCPFNCLFCETKIICGKKFRAHSSKRVVDDITYLNSKLKVKNLQLFDDTFTIDKKRVNNICDMIIDAGLDIRWNCLSRLDTITPELLKKMNKAGCELIAYGIESGSNEILRNMHKGSTIEQAKNAVKWSKDANIKVRAFFMVGNIGETKETAKRTIEFPKELDVDYLNTSIVTPFPGSHMWEIYNEKGYIKNPNSDYTMFSEPMIELPDLSSDELKELASKAHKDFYLRKSYILKQLSQIRTLGQLRAKLLAGIGVFLDGL